MDSFLLLNCVQAKEVLENPFHHPCLHWGLNAALKKRISFPPEEFFFSLSLIVDALLLLLLLVGHVFEM